MRGFESRRGRFISPISGLSGLFEAIPWGGRAAVDQFDFGNSEGTAQASTSPALTGSVTSSFANSNTQLDAPQIWRTTHAPDEKRRDTVEYRWCSAKLRLRQPPPAKLRLTP
jgi:hypothetical protein